MSGGVVATRVAANMRLLRKRCGLSTYDVAARLREIGWPIAQTGVARIETGQRQVSVDDLVAIASVLGCSPNRLLCPIDPGPGECAVGELHTDGTDLWAWACGERPLRTRGGVRASRVDEAVFVIENQPHHAVGGKARWGTEGAR